MFVVWVVVAPALAALTEVLGNVVAAPLEVFVAKVFFAALAILISIYADVIATPVLLPVPAHASVHAVGLMRKDKEEKERD